MKSLLLVLSGIFLFVVQQDLQEQLAKSDQLFYSFNNRATYNFLLEIQKKYPNNADVLWRLSRVVYHIADHMPTSTSAEKDAQLAEYQKAYNYADEAVKSDPKNSMAYTYRAVANGKIALFKGVFSVSGIVNSVRQDCEKAISLDPNNAIAYYVLGRTHAKLAEKPKMFRWPLGLAWGNIDDAIKFYNKAVSIDPNFVMFRLDLARAYISQDLYQQARQQLQAIPQLPKRDEDDDQMKAEAAKLLQEIKNK